MSSWSAFESSTMRWSSSQCVLLGMRKSEQIAFLQAVRKWLIEGCERSQSTQLYRGMQCILKRAYVMSVGKYLKWHLSMFTLVANDQTPASTLSAMDTFPTSDPKCESFCTHETLEPMKEIEGGGISVDAFE